MCAGSSPANYATGVALKRWNCLFEPVCAPRDAPATNQFTTAGAPRQPGQPANPNPPPSPCQRRSVTGSSPLLQARCKHVPRMFLACFWLLAASSCAHPTPVAAPPARRDVRPAALPPAFRLGSDPIQPPGLAPAHNHRSQYRDGAGIVKVTKIAAERAQAQFMERGGDGLVPTWRSDSA
jgi:hypothetical protein